MNFKLRIKPKMDEKWFNVQDIVKQTIFALSDKVNNLEKIVCEQRETIKELKNRKIGKTDFQISLNNVYYYMHTFS